LPTKPKYTLILLVLIVAIFIYGLAQLMSLRFESGDIYPAYSSLRSDPLGTRAFFDSLDKLNFSNIRRHYLPLSQLKFKAPTTFLYLGSDYVNSKFIGRDFSDAVDRMTDAGGRLVMAFRPLRGMEQKIESTDDSGDCPEEDNRQSDPESDQDAAQSSADETDDSGSVSKPPEGKQVVDQPDGCITPNCRSVSVEEYWGVSFDYNRPEHNQNQAMIVPGKETAGLPSEISWHTDLVFEPSESSWEVIYRRDGHPVIIERPFKLGTIVLVADSYLFSNEALRAERHSALLARIIGSNSRIVFDEGHFGIYKVPGVAELIRTHGLHWFFFGIALIFVLFVWKNSSHFVPPVEDIIDETATDGTQGRDIFQGLISLLRRNIPAKDILKVSLNEWKKSLDIEERLHSEQLARIIGVIDMEQAVSENEVNPVKGYVTISRILSEEDKNE
jgi:hypothetical protein